MNETAQPQGRSMKELHAIIAAEDRRRERLLEAWADLPEDDQEKVIVWAREIRAKHDSQSN